jgi:hypothetical protein
MLLLHIVYLETGSKTKKEKFKRDIGLKLKHQNETISFDFCFRFDFIQPLFFDKILSKFVTAFSIYVRIYLNQFRQLFSPDLSDILK